MIRKLLNLYILRNKEKSIKQAITLHGNNHVFCRSTYIELADGSNKRDVVISDHVMVLGTIASQNGGKVFLGEYSQLGRNSIIGSVNEVIIGEYTAISDGVVIMDNNNHPVNPEDRLKMQKSNHGSELRRWKYSDSKPIKIGKNVWVGMNARINKGVEIGDNSIVGANSVVTKTVPKNSIVAGNPAIIVKVDIDKVQKVFK